VDPRARAAWPSRGASRKQSWTPSVTRRSEGAANRARVSWTRGAKPYLARGRRASAKPRQTLRVERGFRRVNVTDSRRVRDSRRANRRSGRPTPPDHRRRGGKEKVRIQGVLFSKKTARRSTWHRHSPHSNTPELHGGIWIGAQLVLAGGYAVSSRGKLLRGPIASSSTKRPAHAHSRGRVFPNPGNVLGLASTVLALHTKRSPRMPCFVLRSERITELQGHSSGEGGCPDNRISAAGEGRIRLDPVGRRGRPSARRACPFPMRVVSRDALNFMRPPGRIAT